MTEYLLRWQKELDHWKPQTVRPPTEESLFTISYFALHGLKHFSTDEQQARIETRASQVRAWLLRTKAIDTEDHVFRLRALQVAGAPAMEIQTATRDLLGLQRADGGWAQMASMETDA